MEVGMATLKELSESTGYSSATISRILNGDPTLSVTEETRRIVLEAAGRINYIATRSKRGRTPKKAFHVAVAEMMTPVQQLNDPYYLYLSSYIRQGCIDNNFTYVPLERYGDTFSSRNAVSLSGIVAIGEFTAPQIESLSSLSKNIVFIDSSPFESRFDSVVLGYELGISLALEHLFQLNHKRIGFIGSIYNYNDWRARAPEARRQHFLRIMREHNLLDPALVLNCAMDIEATKKAVQGFLRSGTPLPTAFLCANEEIAIGTLVVLKENGLSVPDDISVVSFNDTPKSTLVTPQLTSVSTHVEEMSRVALRLLAERASIGGNDPIRTLPLKVTVPPSLVVRDSTAPAK